MNECSTRLAESDIFNQEQARKLHAECRTRLEAFVGALDQLVATRDPKLRIEYNIKALGMAADLRAYIMELARMVNEHNQLQQAALTRQFRWMVIGIALAFMVVINLCVMVMIRAAQMVLRPVDKLVIATRELAKENFTYHVEMDSHDEFSDLAQAYNQMAEQLEGIEQRRLEVMQQMSLALNHELNNALAIIEMQLTLLKRRTEGDPEFEKRLQQIRESLARMSKTVDSLKHIRRIVLTDYTSGQKMIDLVQSTDDRLERIPANHQ